MFHPGVRVSEQSAPQHLRSRRKRPSVLVMCGPNSNRLVIHFGRRLMVKGTLLDKPSGKLS